MWGVIVAIVIAVVAAIFHIGKEGMRQYRTHLEWTDEEVERVKGSYVVGWIVFTVCFILAGIMLLVYRYYIGLPGNGAEIKDLEWTRYLFLQMSCAMFTWGILAIGLLLYAKKDKRVYRIICMSKTERGIKPTVSQKIASGVDQILKENLNDDAEKVEAGYYGKYKNFGKGKRK